MFKCFVVQLDYYEIKSEFIFKYFFHDSEKT